jgi:multidrug efflux pump subunit AcrA (membrane-fusion protein)
MKQSLYCLLLFSIFISCKNNDAADKTDINKVKLATSIYKVIGIGQIVPEHDIIQLSSPVNGIVQKIYKNENDSLSAGTPILELDHQLEDAKVNQLSNEVNTQLEQINADAASVGEFAAKYNNAVAELQRLQRLLAKGAETQQTVDDANTNLKSFQSNQKRLQANVEVAKSKLKETKAALHSAMIEREQKIILSPVNGKLLELNILMGGAVNTQQSIAQIEPSGKTIAVCEIDELNAAKILVGQKGWIRNVGSADTLSTGTVYFAFSFLKKKSLFTDQSGEKEDRRVRTIKMMLDSPDKLLLNARVECVIDISNNLKK